MTEIENASPDATLATTPAPSTAATSMPASPMPASPMPAPPMDVPPDRLAIQPRSPFFDGDKLGRGIGIRFKGVVRTNVEEYCVSEGWVRVQAGRSVDRKGNPLTIKLSGPVESWYEDLGDGAPVLKL